MASLDLPVAAIALGQGGRGAICLYQWICVGARAFLQGVLLLHFIVDDGVDDGLFCYSILLTVGYEIFALELKH